MKDLKVEIKISDKVRERLIQEEMKEAQAAAEQELRATSLKYLEDR